MSPTLSAAQKRREKKHEIRPSVSGTRARHRAAGWERPKCVSPLGLSPPPPTSLKHFVFFFSVSLILHTHTHVLARILYERNLSDGFIRQFRGGFARDRNGILSIEGEIEQIPNQSVSRRTGNRLFFINRLRSKNRSVQNEEKHS